MRRWYQHTRLARCLVLVFAAFFALLPEWMAPGAVSALEDRAGDLYWRLSASKLEERRVVLVDIDERSLREIGPWPWPRATIAELVQRIDSAGASAQMLDIVLAEARPDDAVLAESLLRSSPVVAQLFSLDPGVTPSVGLVVQRGPLGCDAEVPNAFGHYGLSPLLAKALPPTGHITPSVASDGVIRHLPARICAENRMHPQLVLAALVQAAQSKSDRRLGEGGQWRSVPGSNGLAGWLDPPRKLGSSSLPGMELPTDSVGSMRIPYRLNREAFTAIAAADVLSGQSQVNRLLAGSIVLVGSTAFGMGDKVASPLGSVVSGLEVHAQALVGMLDGAIPYTPAGIEWLKAFAFLVISASLWVAAASKQGPTAKRLPLLGLLAALVTLAVAVGALRFFSVWLPWLSVVLFCMLGAGSLAALEHGLARLQRERLSQHLTSYLPRSVAAKLLLTEPSGNPQFDPRQGVVLVCSIRNFSAMASVAVPNELAAFLHAYVCLVVDAIKRHHGMVEQIAGDVVTAIWSDSTSDTSRHAAMAARQIVQVTEALLASRRPVSEISRAQPLALGIGLEFGSVLLGSYGPASRRAHVALGDAVNVAAQLQILTADLSVPVLLGPRVAERLPSEVLESLGDYLLEGFERPTGLFALADWRDFAAGDPMWARSATAVGDVFADAGRWAKWRVPSEESSETHRSGEHSLDWQARAKQ